ncbi:hypothetical protein [uncultured Pelagimonas sp.]|uniref:hypothetical protein n=1 Tax=uncultured Pelagimonas sp. TaxID=1618102 RepID=UPI00260ED621|nr:hypothetical protein [uncultured Pelagimonas sp.]
MQRFMAIAGRQLPEITTAFEVELSLFNPVSLLSFVVMTKGFHNASQACFKLTLAAQTDANRQTIAVFGKGLSG